MMARTRRLGILWADAIVVSGAELSLFRPRDANKDSRPDVPEAPEKKKKGIQTCGLEVEIEVAFGASCDRQIPPAAWRKVW